MRVCPDFSFTPTPNIQVGSEDVSRMMLDDVLALVEELWLVGITSEQRP